MSVLSCRCHALTKIPRNPGPWVGSSPLPKPRNWNPASATDSPIGVELYAPQTPYGRGFLRPPRWSLIATNNDKWIWWTCKNSVDRIRGTNICWPWSMSCLSMPGPSPSNPNAAKTWYVDWKAFTNKPRRGDRSTCRRIKAKNFTIEGCKRGSRNRGDIIFRRMGIVRPPWWNDGIAPWNNGCTLTLPPTIRYGTWMCYNRWSIRTITPIIGVLGWPRIKSPPTPCPRSRTDSSASAWTQRPHPPKCQVGDRVRLNKKHRPFKKGYLPGWTEDR